MPRALEETRQFKRDKKRIQGSGRNDWLLIYDKEGPRESGSLKLIRTGSHSELF